MEHLVHINNSSLDRRMAAMLRKCRTEDMKFVLAVRNQPHVVAISNRSKELTLDEFPHPDDPRHRMWVVTDSGVDCGYVMAELVSENRAIIGIALTAKAGGRGLGTRSIRTACELLFAECGVPEIVAEVYEDNVPSRRAFSNAGFVAEATTVVPDGRTKIIYIYRASR